MHITFLYQETNLQVFVPFYIIYAQNHLFQYYNLRAFEDDVVLEHNFGNSLCLFTRFRSCWTTF